MLKTVGRRWQCLTRVLAVFRLCLGVAGRQADRHNGAQRSADDMHKLHMKGASAAAAAAGSDAAVRCNLQIYAARAAHVPYPMQTYTHIL